MQVFHRGGAENDEKAHPERSALKWNRFVVLAFLFFILIGFENDGIEEKSEQAQYQDEFNAENPEIFGMVLHALACLRYEDLIDVVQVDAAGEQQNDQKESGHTLVMFVEGVGDRTDIFFGKAACTKTRCHRHHEEGEPADPDDGRQEMKPMVDDRKQLVQIEEEALH